MYRSLSKVEDNIRRNLFEHLQRSNIKVLFSDTDSNQIRTKKQKHVPVKGVRHRRHQTVAPSLQQKQVGYKNLHASMQTRERILFSSG